MRMLPCRGTATTCNYYYVHVQETRLRCIQFSGKDKWCALSDLGGQQRAGILATLPEGGIREHLQEGSHRREGGSPGGRREGQL